MNHQSSRTLMEMRTTLGASEVLAAAKTFFTRRNSIYTAFIEQESPTHVSLRGQGGEELLIGVRPLGDATGVTGSTYLFDMQVQRFFATLPPASEPEPEPEPAAAAPTAAAGAA